MAIKDRPTIERWAISIILVSIAWYVLALFLFYIKPEISERTKGAIVYVDNKYTFTKTGLTFAFTIPSLLMIIGIILLMIADKEPFQNDEEESYQC